ncbi:MAG: hypothetical protein ACP5UO_04845 [Thermoplasmata archaeon]
MGRLELQMIHARLPATTRYATYRTGPPEDGLRHFDVIAVLQIFVKELEKYSSALPENLRVTVEWDDSPVESGKI